MGRYSELIKNFEKVRDYMKDFFIFGFKTRSDFEYKSLRTYDNEKRRIESWLSDYIKFDNSKKGKQISLSCDSGRLYENPFFKAYRSKSFTDNDIELHYFITDILIDKSLLTVDEIADSILKEYGIYFEPQTIRIKLKEYADEGIIKITKDGKAYKYSICIDTAENICENQENFFDMIRFFSQCGMYGEIGNCILKQCNKNNDIFLMKHNFIVHSLEDNIMLELEKAIDEQRKIEILNFGRSGSKNIIYGIPVKFHVSVYTGRRYIVMYIENLKRFNSFRLDYIKKVKALEKYDDYDKIKEAYERNALYCWGTSFGDIRQNGNTEKIKLTVYADEKNEPFIIERLMRESRNGMVTRTDENTYTYEAEVFDAGETASWIKSFIGRIISFECSNENIVKRVYGDIIRMSRIYNEE